MPKLLSTLNNAKYKQYTKKLPGDHKNETVQNIKVTSNK